MDVSVLGDLRKTQLGSLFLHQEMILIITKYHGILDDYNIYVIIFIHTHTFLGVSGNRKHDLLPWFLISVSGGAAAEGWRICANAGRRRLRLGQHVEKLT